MLGVKLLDERIVLHRTGLGIEYLSVVEVYQSGKALFRVVAAVLMNHQLVLGIFKQRTGVSRHGRRAGHISELV